MKKKMKKWKRRYLKSRIRKLKNNNDFISKTNKNEKWKLIIKLVCPIWWGIVMGSSNSPFPIVPCFLPFSMVSGWFLSSQSKIFLNPIASSSMFPFPLEGFKISKIPNFPLLCWISLIFWRNLYKVWVHDCRYIFMLSWYGFADW